MVTSENNILFLILSSHLKCLYSCIFIFSKINVMCFRSIIFFLLLVLCCYISCLSLLQTCHPICAFFSFALRLRPMPSDSVKGVLNNFCMETFSSCLISRVPHLCVFIKGVFSGISGCVALSLQFSHLLHF